MNIFQEKIKKMMDNAGIDIDSLPTMDEVEKKEKMQAFAEIRAHVDSVFGVQFSGVNDLGNLGIRELNGVKTFLNNPEMVFLCLRGGTGTAKTAVAKILYSEYIRGFFMRTGRLSQAIGQAVYFRALEFFDTLKQQNSEPGGGKDFINFYSRNIGLMILDEVGASYGTEFERMYFNQLIDDFYNQKHRRQKMILISNAPDHASLERYLGKPALSRIDHRGLVVNMRDMDYRKQFRRVVAG